MLPSQFEALSRYNNLIFRTLWAMTVKKTETQQQKLYTAKAGENHQGGDYIGPPNKVSNLRPIIFHVPENESSIEKKYRLQREKTQKWNEEFWAKHNENYFKERDAFMKGKDNPSPDEMSVFYKRFLDDNWSLHLQYNLEWYRQNIHLLFMSLIVYCQNTLILKKKNN